MLAKAINPFEGLFDQFFSEFNLNNNKMIQKCKNQSNFPRHNIVSSQKQVTIQLAVPGYKQEQLSVNIEDRILTVQGEAKLQNISTQSVIIAHGIKSSYFKKSYQLLDQNLSTEDIKCQLNEGILTIHISKITQDQTKKKVKKIPINK